MTLDRFSKFTNQYTTQALRFIKGDKVKAVVSYSKSKGKRKWHDNDMNPVRFGLFKSQEYIFTARALVVGRHKFSLLVANK